MHFETSSPHETDHRGNAHVGAEHFAFLPAARVGLTLRAGEIERLAPAVWRVSASDSDRAPLLSCDEASIWRAHVLQRACLVARRLPRSPHTHSLADSHVSRPQLYIDPARTIRSLTFQ